MPSNTISLEEFQSLPDTQDVPVSKKNVISLEEFSALGDVETAIQTGDTNEYKFEAQVYNVFQKGDRDFIDNITESFRRSNEDAAIVKDLTWESLRGRLDYDSEVKPIKIEYEKKLQEDPIRGGNVVSDAIYTVAGMLPDMGKGILEGLKYGIPLGAVTSLVPGGQRVAPKVFQAASTLGSASYWYRQGASELYGTLKDEDIEDEIAVPISHIGGAIYGAIEFSQVTKLIPGTKESIKKMVKTKVKDTVKGLVKKYGVNWIQEIGEEGLQEVVMSLSEDIARNAAGKAGTATEQMIANAIVRGWSAAKESAIPMLILMAPGAAIDTKRALKKKKKLTKKQIYKPASDAEAFKKQLSISSRAGFLEQKTIKQIKEMDIYLSDDGKSGYGITKDGTLVSVFNNSDKKGLLKIIVPEAIINGATSLDAYEGFLSDAYAKYGFEIVETIAWDDKYAPAGWDYKKYGRPNVVRMEYKGGKYVTDSSAEDKHGEGVLRPRVDRQGGDGSGDQKALEQAQQEQLKQNRALVKKKKSKTGKQIANVIDKVLVPISTRLKKINPILKNAMRKYEFDVNKAILEDEKAVKPFLDKMEKMSETDFTDLDLALKNGLTDVIERIITKHKATKEYNAVRDVLNNIYKKAQAVGYKIGYLNDYMPRRVRDVEEFLAYFYSSDKSDIVRSAVEKKEMDVGRKLEDSEIAALINTLLRGYEVAGITLSKPGYLKERNIDYITPEINQFYYDSQSALVDYIYSVNDAIAARKFFGKAVQFNNKTNPLTEEEIASGKKPSGSIYDFNLESTIGAYVLDLLVKGEITPSQELELKEILMARFSPKGPGALLAGLKNLGYITTMANPISAITQIGDLAFAFYKSGVLKGTGAFVEAVVGQSKITKEDVGIERIAQEFSEGSKVQKFLTTAFKVVGLEWMDKIGKQTLINAAYKKYKSQAKKKKVNKAFKSRLDEIFGAEADQVIDDFKNDRVTENLKMLLFSDLADFQPIALSEMPQGYLRGGNGRVLYMLKTYTIKMWDVYRNEVELEPDKIKAAKNFVSLTMALVLMNATADVIKDWLLGRKLDFGEMLFENILRIAGFSKYAFYEAKREGIARAVAKGYLIPPLEPFNTGDLLIKDITRAVKEGELDLNDLDVIQRIPFVGKLYYWWFGRGREKSSSKSSSGKRR